MKLLIVDDEKGIRDVIKEYAKLEHYEIIEASDGEEAIEAIQNEDVDCMVLDIMMPHLDGLSALKEIKKQKNILKIKNNTPAISAIISQSSLQNDITDISKSNIMNISLHQ